MVPAPPQPNSGTTRIHRARCTRRHKETVMNPIHPIHRLACILAGLTAGLLALVTASPAAFARPGPLSVTPTALATPRPLPPDRKSVVQAKTRRHAVGPSSNDQS